MSLSNLDYQSLFLNAINDDDRIERSEQEIFEYVTDVASGAVADFLGGETFGKFDFFFEPGGSVA